MQYCESCRSSGPACTLWSQQRPGTQLPWQQAVWVTQRGDWPLPQVLHWDLTAPLVQSYAAWRG